jgi:hypothetical protein
VVNPDGYDYTFTEDNRLWRKNLRDNDGDGQISASADGVDLNRNFPTNWGYDNEGSSPVPSSQVYRGTRPASEPETRAQNRLMRRIGFNFLVNYHSAAELLLYGVGWQVDTPTPDDLIYRALAGDDEEPAVEGFDPDLSAELYTTNGETLDHAQTRHGILGFTPELTQCETVSDPDTCDSGFNFPDDETLIQEEFERNLSFAGHRALHARPRQPRVAPGQQGARFQGRPLPSVVRQPADRGDDRRTRARAGAAALPRQRRPLGDQAHVGVAGR